MGSGAYVAYTGALANQRALDVIANNVANVSTSGFRRDNTIFDSALGARLHFASAESSRIDLSPGQQQLTGSPLNAAIAGEGFFAVLMPNGEQLYTRRGDFRQEESGMLVLPSGLPVLGVGGPIQVPAGKTAQISGDGTVYADGQPYGRLRVVEFDDRNTLVKEGESLIRANDASKLREIVHPRLAVGYVEASNVNLAAEMVSLITASRSFEAAVRSMNIQDELTARLINSQNG
jgi:flagellar basal body rod protein FlgG